MQTTKFKVGDEVWDSVNCNRLKSTIFDYGTK
jgi:hypothetical protein